MEKEIVFNEYRTFFTDLIENPENFIKFFQKQLFRIDIMGIKTEHEMNKISLFGEEIIDSQLAKPMDLARAKQFLAKSRKLPQHYPICHVSLDLNVFLQGIRKVDTILTPILTRVMEVRALGSDLLVLTTAFLLFPGCHLGGP